jgi:hypothetical protein
MKKSALKRILVTLFAVTLVLSVFGAFANARRHGGHHYPPAHCFIATASYGTDHSSIAVLQEFRDGHLLTNSPGRVLVSLYYKNSPPIARFIEKNEWSKPLVRTALLPAVGFCYLVNITG